MRNEEVENWVVPIVGPGYEVRYAPWVETGLDDDTKYLVIGSEGGPGPAVQVRRKNYNVFLIGPRNAPEVSEQLMSAAEGIMAVINTEDSPMPCGAAIIAATGEPVGPGLTDDNRAWVQISLQITF